MTDDPTSLASAVSRRRTRRRRAGAAWSRLRSCSPRSNVSARSARSWPSCPRPRSPPANAIWPMRSTRGSACPNRSEPARSAMALRPASTARPWQAPPRCRGRGRSSSRRGGRRGVHSSVWLGAAAAGLVIVLAGGLLIRSANTDSNDDSVAESSDAAAADQLPSADPAAPAAAAADTIAESEIERASAGGTEAAPSENASDVDTDLAADAPPSDNGDLAVLLTDRRPRRLRRGGDRCTRVGRAARRRDGHHRRAGRSRHRGKRAERRGATAEMPRCRRRRRPGELPGPDGGRRHRRFPRPRPRVHRRRMCSGRQRTASLTHRPASPAASRPDRGR